MSCLHSQFVTLLSINIISGILINRNGDGHKHGLYNSAYDIPNPNLGGVPVRFSLDPTLLTDECHKLLELYMPEQIRKTKITQKMFIK